MSQYSYRTHMTHYDVILIGFDCKGWSEHAPHPCTVALSHCHNYGSKLSAGIFQTSTAGHHNHFAEGKVTQQSTHNLSLEHACAATNACSGCLGAEHGAKMGHNMTTSVSMKLYDVSDYMM